MKNNWLNLYGRLLKISKKNLLTFIFCTIISSVSEFLLFSLVGIILRSVLDLVKSNKLEITKMIIYGVFVMCFCTFASTSICYIAKNQQKIVAKIRKMMIDSYVNMKESYATKFPQNEILNRLNTDAQMVSNIVGMEISGFYLIGMVSGLISIIYLFVINYKIAIIAIICSLGNTLVAGLYKNKLRNLQKEFSDDNSNNSAFLTEAIYGKTEINSYNLSPVFRNKMKIILEKISHNIKRNESLLGLKNGIIFIFENCFSVLLLLFVGGMLSDKGFIKFGDIMIAIALIEQIGRFITGTVGFKTYITRYIPIMERVFEVIDLQKEVDIEKSTEIDKIDIIELKNVSFGYGKDDVLKDINMKIEAGEKIAIIGESGSGKSTITKLILGLYNANSGEIKFNGININNIKKSDIREKIGYLPQKPEVFSCSIVDNIALSNKIDIDKILRASEMAYANEFIKNKENDFNEVVDNNNLSGGQKQRIALARCFYKNKKILIMDEPTSALDEKSEAYLKNIINNLPKDYTIIVITHRINFTKDFNKIFILENGKIQDYGVHNDLIKRNKLYSSLYS